jgi:addiction module RelE/StbE family toxin
LKNLVWSTAFARSAKRLLRQNPKLRSQFEQTLQQLAEDPFSATLRTHKLKGDLASKWACSIDYSNRIIFKIVDTPDSGEELLLLAIGSHDEVY